MNDLPIYLIDTIFEFNSPSDIIKCKILNKQYKKNLEKIFTNRNSFIQKKYLDRFRIDKKESWFKIILKLNNFTIENNIETYKIIFKNISFKKNDFFNIFNYLRDIYDTSNKKNIGILFFDLFFYNLNIFKVNIYSLNELEKYKQEICFYYLIDIYINSKKEEYLKYLSIIFDNLFEFIVNLKNKDEFNLHRVIFNYIYACYVRKPKITELYKLFLNKIDEYELDIYYENDIDDDYYDAYNFIFSDY